MPFTAKFLEIHTISHSFEVITTQFVLRLLHMHLPRTRESKAAHLWNIKPYIAFSPIK